MPIKLKRVLHDITAEQAIEWYDVVFLDESDTDIINFHNELYSSSLRNFISRVQLLDELDEHVYYVLDENDNVVGYASSYEPRWSGFRPGREFGIFIKTKYRNAGLGTQVISRLEQMYPGTLYMSPLATNTQAISLYERLGYTNTRVISEDYGLLLMFKINFDS